LALLRSASGDYGLPVIGMKWTRQLSDTDIDANITNICQCGSYERLRRAIHRAADMMKV